MRNSQNLGCTGAARTKAEIVETDSDTKITVTVSDRRQMDRRLDEAVALARTRAMGDARQGVLVTRPRLPFLHRRPQ
jgi:hypothetical protein